MSGIEIAIQLYDKIEKYPEYCLKEKLLIIIFIVFISEALAGSNIGFSLKPNNIGRIGFVNLCQ